jgi:hypothetical protein
MLKRGAFRPPLRAEQTVAILAPAFEVETETSDDPDHLTTTNTHTASLLAKLSP